MASIAKPAVGLGSGPTTILFTDIEGSTRLWETQPDAMSRALKKHDALARGAVERNGGVVVKMIGDGMYAAFADPMDGVTATIELQEALADPAATEGVPIRIRCGLHLGEVEHRDNDFFGPPVNRSARIMGAAHGGQILLSQAVVDQVGARLPADVVVKDLGGVRLKDLASPERVYQIVHPKLRQDFPALRSLEATPNNLPQQLTAFFGREKELQDLGRLLKGSRLLTLCGMGGLGKTRLSLQVAADAMDDFPDGVWFVDLAPLQDASLVPSAVAQALSLQEEPGRNIADTVAAHLKSRTALIILDNCEHLVGACAKLANALLRAACDLRIIATTREALRVPGEQTYTIHPLPLPDRGAGLDAIAKSDAVQLFVDRARQHKPAFELTEREAPGVAEIVARLEGIPLALELAAARVRALSLADINTRLRDRFKLLTGGGRVLMERQQTLRALVQWSYDLLNEQEQCLFDRLCVFAGGFDVEAAEKVCGEAPLAPEDVLDLVASLVEKSLVNAEERDEGTRYRALETIRDFAREKLAARGEADSIAVRHCDYFFAFAKLGRDGIRGEEQATWMQRLETELDNMRGAIALALQGSVDQVIAVKFAVALMNFWIFRGYVTEGRKILDNALALDAVRGVPRVHAFALYTAAALAITQGNFVAAQAMLAQCLKLRREIGDSVDIAATLSTLALVHLRTGDVAQARTAEQEGLRLFREAKDRIGEAIGLLHLGQVSVYAGDDQDATAQLEAARKLAREMKHCEIESECERVLGEIALWGGDHGTARQHLTRSLTLCREVSDRRNEALATWMLARLDLQERAYDRARQQLDEAVDAFLASDMREEALAALDDYVRLAVALGAHDAAPRLVAAAEAQRSSLSLRRAPREQKLWESALRDVAPAGASAAPSEAADWTLQQAFATARTAVANVAMPAAA